MPSQLELPAGVLWDMDGTLIDSEPYWIAAETELVESFGGVWTHEMALQMVGNSLLTSARILREAGVDMEPPNIVEWLLDRVVAATAQRVPWQPGALELLRNLAQAGVPCALVTASYRRFADVVVAAADGLLAVSVAGDEVVNGKPDPEAFLLAAELLGVDPKRCVAVEDSPPGIAAAMASGARVLGAEATVPLPEFPGLSRTTSLAAVGLADLSRIAAGEVLDLRRH